MEWSVWVLSNVYSLGICAQDKYNRLSLCKILLFNLNTPYNSQKFIREIVHLPSKILCLIHSKSKHWSRGHNLWPCVSLISDSDDGCGHRWHCQSICGAVKYIIIVLQIDLRQVNESDFLHRLECPWSRALGNVQEIVTVKLILFVWAVIDK